MQKTLILGQFEAIEDYYTWLEFYDLHEDSICYTLNEFVSTSAMAEIFDTCYLQEKYGNDDVDGYAIGGVQWLDVYESRQDFENYRETKKYVKKLIKHLTN